MAGSAAPIAADIVTLITQAVKNGIAAGIQQVEQSDGHAHFPPLQTAASAQLDAYLAGAQFNTLVGNLVADITDNVTLKP